MTNKPYGLEVRFKSKTKTFWFETREARREQELRLISNSKALVVTTIGKPD